MTDHDWVKYRRLKDQIRAGVMLPREDFLFVKGIDQCRNNRSAIVKARRPGRSLVSGGLNTAPR